jgi:N-acetylneuraminic acid mutarotase
VRRFAVVVLLVAAACASAKTPPSTSTTAPAPSAEAPHLSWSSAPSLPLPRTEVTAAALDGMVYVGGGLTANGQATNRVDVFDPLTNKWATSVPFPAPLHHTSLLATGGRLYLVGGYRADGTATAKVWSRAPGEPSWRAEPSMPTPRGAFVGVVDGAGRIHVIGGASRFEPLGHLIAVHEVFDPATKAWTTAAPMPSPRDHAAGACVGNTIVVAGGRNLSLTQNKARVDLFDVSSGTWKRGPDLKVARGGIAAVASGGFVYVFGGEGPSATFRQVEYYDVAASRWRLGPDMPDPRHGLGAAQVGDRVYVIGGGPRPGVTVTGANEVLSLK